MTATSQVDRRSAIAADEEESNEMVLLPCPCPCPCSCPHWTEDHFKVSRSVVRTSALEGVILAELLVE